MKGNTVKPIQVGIWGLGRAGWGMHCQELGQFPDKFQIVAGCDIEADRLKLFKERYPDADIWQDGAEFLADPRIELVAVAVRSPQHVDYALRALAAGKMVFLEKPIALTVEGVKKLEDAVKKYPGKLFFRHNRRFEACFNHVLEIMHSGILGEVYELKLCRHCFEFRDDWQTLLDCGGGQLNNWGPHLLDQGLRFLESPLKSVWSQLRRIAALGDAEDHLKIILQGENNRIVDIEISGGVALPSPVYAVYGTRGSLVSEDEQDIKLKYLNPRMKIPTTPAHAETPPMNGNFGGSIEPEWIRKTIMTEPANGFNVNVIYQLLYQSIREGKPYPILPEEAFEVVRVAAMVKQQNPAFRIHPDEFGK